MRRVHGVHRFNTSHRYIILYAKGFAGGLEERGRRLVRKHKRKDGGKIRCQEIRICDVNSCFYQHWGEGEAEKELSATFPAQERDTVEHRSW